MAKDTKKKPQKAKAAPKQAAPKKTAVAKAAGKAATKALDKSGAKALDKSGAKALAKSGAKARPKAALPLPPEIPAVAAPRKAVLQAEARHLAPLEVPVKGEIAVLTRLWETVEARRLSGDTVHSHSARLMARGTPKVAQKLGEEAVELVIEAVARNREATIAESADVLYHLMVLLVDAGIQPGEVWAELRRREGISGIVEKASRPRPKALLAIAQTSKLP